MKLAAVFFTVLVLFCAVSFPQTQTEEEPQQMEPQRPTEGDEESEPEGEDTAGQVEAITEAMTEMKNVLDLLSKLRISGYVQGQYVDDESSVDQANGPAATRNRNQFSVRRGRLNFVYTANPTARFRIQLDASSSGVALRDAYVELIEPWTTWKNTLTVGQFKWPFGFEVLYSSADREMPERSRVVRALFPGERDRGVQLSGLGMGERFRYYVAVVNGSGTNVAFDFNEDKDLVARAGYTIGPVDFAGSIYSGSELVATTSNPAGAEFDKERVGFDVQFITPVPGLGGRVEYITGEERGADVAGWYVDLIQNLGTRHQFVVRFDQYDPNVDADNNATFTIGGAYLFHWDANTKLTLAYEAPEAELNDPADNITTVRIQYRF